MPFEEHKDDESELLVNMHADPSNEIDIEEMFCDVPSSDSDKEPADDKW